MGKEKDTLSHFEAYKVAIATRNFEIDLYWKRSLFFWGFIATAALGYGSSLLAEKPNHNLALLIACFGFICSLCWSLVNRGSKYWQEHWERKVTDFEETIGTTELFRAEDKLDDSKSCWLGARKYSVSRIAIALSDFSLLIWLSLIVNHIISYFPEHIHLSKEVKIFLVVFGTFIYMVLILFVCKSKVWEKPTYDGNQS
ncbi:hypothetical protein R1U54_000181 [Vibrio fluvialis]|nr:hypothetical protein [Vibrio fluvialis]ELP2650128.1 hypothetical protein [Vibrio fluvialis]